MDFVEKTLQTHYRGTTLMKQVSALPSAFQEYERMVIRMPGVVSAQIYQDDGQAPRVHIVSKALTPPRQMIRQVVSLLRNMGWQEMAPELVTIVQVAAADEDSPGHNRLKIFGYSLVRAGALFEARCRLGRGTAVFEGRAEGGIPATALAEATVAAVNETLGGAVLAFLDVSILQQVEHSVVLAMVRFGKAEVLTGSAVVHGVVEETVVRATLDAVNRRVVLYTGAKPE
jgi:hypothetical protein